MKKSFTYFLYFTAIISLSTCKTPYNPAPTTTVTNYLVVEGLINISDSTYIKLSRTVNLSNASTNKPELNAKITIESNTNSSYALIETGNGNYVAPNFNLSSINEYRLRIKTSNGEQYVSDFAPTVVSPPIDSVTFKATTDLKIYVNTHDPKNATRYYRWDYTEAWEFRSGFNSNYISDGLQIIPRTPSQQIWDCFTSDVSSTIVLGSSAQLNEDIINQALINTIAHDAEKIGYKYSILVKQYALTKDAYNYWTLLQKNTQQLGGIFDAQPSASIGNIHCVNNPSEVVIGYISSGTITSSRIFIAKSELPNWVTTPFYPKCEADTINRYVPPNEDEILNYKSLSFQGYITFQIPITPFYTVINGSQLIIGYLAAPPMCVDCTLRGSTTPPAYWK